MKYETESIYSLLETIGDMFYIEIFNNNNIKDDVYEVLKDSLKQDLIHILDKIKYYSKVANKQSLK